MNLALLKKAITTSGVVVFLLGIFMIVSHINYGFEIFVTGIVLLPTGLLIPVQKIKNINYEEKVQEINSYPTIKQSVGITGMVLLGMLLFFPVNEILEKFTGKEFSSLIGYVISFGIVFTIINTNRKKKTGESSFNLSIENKRIIPFIMIASIVLNAGVAGPLASLIPMSESIIKIMLQLKDQQGIWTFIMMVIAAPILEELIFRGVILDGLLKRYTPLTAILVSSLLFGVAHFNPWQLVTASLLGIFSGWVYYKTRSLAPCIIMHAGVNLFGYLARYFMDVDENMNESLLESIGVTNFLLLVIGSLILISICIYWLQREFRKEKLEVSIENILEV